jgi:purine-binding chemotaxis protein CheW
MSTASSLGIRDRAAELREDFDRAFAAPLRAEATVTVDLLAIRVGEQTCALRLSEIAGLHAGKKVTRIPGAHSLLRGIAGFRGTVLPVYDLKALLGAACAEAPRWLVVAAAMPVALAFETFIGHLRALPGEIAPRSEDSGKLRHTRDYVRTASFIGPILHLPSLLDALRGSRDEAVPSKE